MSSTNREEEIPIPDVIRDSLNNVTYMKQRFFGKGGFAKCYEIRDTKNNAIFAGKIVSKKLLLKSNQRDKMAQEIQIHRTLKHKHIVSFYDFFEDCNFVYVILELCRKRSMMELHKRRKALTEPEVRYYMKQILDGVSYLHSIDIIHRDLKLGNLFLDDNLQVKIGDFGLAAKIEYHGQRKKTLCGTPNYIAPEILNKKGHSFEVDVWSIGCIMYTLLVGRPPFETNSLRETYAKIKKCEYHLPNTLSKPAAIMVHEMLMSDPSKRPKTSELLEMEFIVNGYCPKELPISCLTTSPRFDNVKEFNNSRKPLIELNQGGNEIAPRARKSVAASYGGPHLTSAAISECSNYLNQLYAQLDQLVKGKLESTPRLNGEEMSDPNAQPFVWISKWVDYSDKYGFGYQLCDDGVGVMFNDSTKLVLLSNHRNVHYIDKDGSENYHMIGSTPSSLDKKMKLLTYFRRYMSEHLMKAGASVAPRESDSISRTPYLHMWHRSTTAVIMQLTNGTLQINFSDHTKVIMCPLMQAVTYIDAQKNFSTYRFCTIAVDGCVPGLADCLTYAHRKIKSMLHHQN